MTTVEELREEMHEIDVRLAKVETRLGLIGWLLGWVLGILTGNLLAVVVFGLFLALKH